MVMDVPQTMGLPSPVTAWGVVGTRGPFSTEVTALPPYLLMCLSAPSCVGRQAFNHISQQTHTKLIPDKLNHWEQLYKEAGSTDTMAQYLLH